MKLLFFSVTKHQYNYFERLKNNLPFTATQQFFPHFNLSLKGLLFTKHIASEKILQYKYTEIENKYTNPLHKAFYKLFIKIQIPWVVSTAYKQCIKHTPEYIVLWNGKKFHQALMAEVAKRLDIKTIFFENGVLPNTTTMDFKGVNASNSLARDALFYDNLHFSQAQRLPDKLITRKAKTKKQTFEVTLPKAYIFVPFQVSYDTQIIQHSPHFSNMTELFNTLVWITQNSNVCFVIKEHPSDRVSDYSVLHQRANAQIIFSSQNTQILIENASAVMTINSSVAIESLLFNKRVIVLGEAFFAIDGIIKIASNKEEIKKILDELNDWNINMQLNEKFLKYIYFDYLIPDSWQLPSQKHYDTIGQRIKEHK